MRDPLRHIRATLAAQWKHSHSLPFERARRASGAGQRLKSTDGGLLMNLVSSVLEHEPATASVEAGPVATPNDDGVPRRYADFVATPIIFKFSRRHFVLR